jgi:hypothetical protein
VIHNFSRFGAHCLENDLMVHKIDISTARRMAFSILITFLEREGPEQFIRVLDSLCIGFKNEGPILSDHATMQNVAGLQGYTKLSDVTAVLELKERIELFREALTPENAEMLLQREILNVADEAARAALQS